MSDVDIAGTVTPDGNWFSFSVVRQTQADGTITFDPDEIAGSPFTMRLRTEHGGPVFSDEVFWADGYTGRKTLATNVIAHTRFTVDARGSQGKTHFSGKLGTP